MPYQKGGIYWKIELVAKDENGNETGRYINDYDLGTKQFAQFVQNNILDTAESVTDTGGTSRSLSANSATSSVNIVAGIGTSAANFTDHALTTPTAGSSGTIAGTVNAISSNTFTVTGTITNTSGSTINYAEVGITVVSATYTFLLTHDVFSALGVSNNGTLAITYTATFT